MTVIDAPQDLEALSDHRPEWHHGQEAKPADPHGFPAVTTRPRAHPGLATCPLPPAENRLTAAIEAGEKIQYEQAAR